MVLHHLPSSQIYHLHPFVSLPRLAPFFFCVLRILLFHIRILFLCYDRFHSLHHTQFRTNYTLFCPLYDYVYGTVDKSTDSVYENALKREAESPDVVHLSHLTTPDSIYHLPLGFPSLSSKPQVSKWYLLFMWPVTVWSLLLTWVLGHAFISERNAFKKLKLQAWVVPKYNMQVRNIYVVL